MQLKMLVAWQGSCGLLGITSAFVCAAGFAHAQQVLIIPQVADGGGFQTEFVLTNTTNGVGSASLVCMQETAAGGGATSAWNLPILESVNIANITIPATGDVFLHTPGTAASLSVGWCQLNASLGVNTFAFFTQFVTGRPNQYGTAPAAASASRILVPFDNTSGFVTSMAIVNPTLSSQTITVATQSDQGATQQQASITLPAQGHMAFTIQGQFPSTVSQRGLAEFSTTSGSIAILAFAFNESGSFTASPVFSETGSPVIGTSPVTGINVFSSFSTGVLLFQPIGQASSNLTATFTPNAGNTSYSVAIGNGPTFTDGTFTNKSVTFTASTLQANASNKPFGLFTSPAGTLMVSSAPITLTLTPSVNLPAPTGTLQEGNISGTFTITGTPTVGGAAVTLSGPVSSTYSAMIPQ